MLIFAVGLVISSSSQAVFLDLIFVDDSGFGSAEAKVDTDFIQPDGSINNNTVVSFSATVTDNSSGEVFHFDDNGANWSGIIKIEDDSVNIDSMSFALEQGENLFNFSATGQPSSLGIQGGAFVQESTSPFRLKGRSFWDDIIIRGPGWDQQNPIPPEEDEEDIEINPPRWPVECSLATFDCGDGLTGGVVGWLDPEVAVGYDFYLDPSVPNIASLVAPVGFGDDIYDLFLLDEFGAFVDSGKNLLAGEEFNVISSLGIQDGIRAFGIRGIEAEEMLDPDNGLAFPMGISFTDDWNSGSVRMVPITTIIDDSTPIPEPPTKLIVLLAIFLMYLISFGRHRAF
ncbi:hypothetical protein DV711_06680 [Motiliproteus coralliicola]|uniref:PEP-CTERM sorting domain-containing protein n=2 Tax=Motiliproteus coralliicola TaxID=2283196 RepID=A0A369WUE4_9GAMM|nr:hypothetical protein DV711_06680 [Motiliproteus coralliicola]